MKAADRCKENFQGDRCKKERSHHFTTNPEKDENHQGSFSAWTGEGDSKKVVAVAMGSRPRQHRNRSLNRWVRAICQKNTDVNLMPGMNRKSASQMMGLVLKALRGEKI